MKNNKKKVKDINKVLNNSLSIPYLILLFMLIIIPLVMMLLYSFNQQGSTFEINFSGTNYIKVFTSTIIIKTIFESVLIALLVTLATLLIAYPLAYNITKLKKHNKVLVLSLLTAPMWINTLIKVFSLKQVFGIFFPDLLGSNIAIIIGLSYIYLPYMVLPIFTVLQSMDKSYIEAASDLGANKFKTFTTTILPLSIPGVMSGILMVFLPSATSLVVPKYLGRGKYLIGHLIEQTIIKNGNYGEGAAIAVIFTLIMMAIIVFVKILDKVRSKLYAR